MSLSFDKEKLDALKDIEDLGWDMSTIIKSNLETLEATNSKFVKMKKYLVDLAENKTKQTRFLYMMFTCIKGDFVCQDVVNEIYREFFKTEMYTTLKTQVNNIDYKDPIKVNENKNLIYIKNVLLSDDLEDTVNGKSNVELGRLKLEAEAIRACFYGIKNKDLCDADKKIISRFSFMAFFIKQEKLFLEETKLLTGGGLIEDLGKARSPEDALLTFGAYILYGIFTVVIEPLFKYVIAPFSKYVLRPFVAVVTSPITLSYVGIAESLPNDVNTVAAYIWAYYNYADMLTDPSFINESRSKLIFKCNCSKMWSLFKVREPFDKKKGLECAKKVLDLITNALSSITDHNDKVYKYLIERCNLIKVYIQITETDNYSLEYRPNLSNPQRAVDFCH